MKKNGFTLIEIIIIIIVISIGILSVLVAINGANKYIAKSRQKIIAINLAKEGVEQVLNIRNTNRQRRGGKKEECRLKTNPLQGTTTCESDQRLGSGTYIILKTGATQKYFFASGNTYPLNTNDGIQSGDLVYSLCESGGNRDPCPNQQPSSKEGKFFRQIQGLGVFQKDIAQEGGKYLNCTNGTSPGCGNSTAKEFRFCVKVEAINEGISVSQICSILTNFKK